MVQHLYLFCFLFLIIFSCHSGKKVTDDNPAVIQCKQRAYYIYAEGENHFLRQEYDLARSLYTKALADSCLAGRKESYGTNKRFVKKEILVTDLIAQRLRQMDEMRMDKIKEKEMQCSKMFQFAEKLYKEQDYIKSKGYFERYKNSDCSPKDSMVDSRIKLLDSLIHVKKN